jgi:tetratricopeptide (TPR) repeat protein
MQRRGLARVCGCALLAGALLTAVGTARADDAAWRDIENRIQYGYYTEDAAALRKLEETVAAADAHDKLRGYYAGLLAWRLALLAAEGGIADGASAQQAQHCVSALDSTLAGQSEFSEALALRAVCLITPFSAVGVRTSLAAHRARRDLDHALQLDSRNPRVLLLDAMSDYELAPARGGNKVRALPKLRQAVQAFETERRSTDRVPGWGAAEAWMLLARDLLDQGDPVGARDALEHALLIAPDFAQARRLMAKIIAG